MTKLNEARLMFFWLTALTGFFLYGQLSGIKFEGPWLTEYFIDYLDLILFIHIPGLAAFSMSVVVLILSLMKPNIRVIHHANKWLMFLYILTALITGTYIRGVPVIVFPILATFYIHYITKMN